MEDTLMRCLQSMTVMILATCANMLAAADADDLRRAHEVLAEDPARALEILGEAPEDDQEREKEPATADAMRGHAHLRLEQWEEARAAFLRALEDEPGLRSAGEGLIQTLARQEDWPALLAQASRWGLTPEARPELLLLAVDAARRAERPLIAAELARHGTLRFPADERFLKRWAVSLDAAERPAEARQVWRDLVAHVPSDPQLWRGLAAAQQRAGDLDAARHSLDVAVALAPEDTATRRSQLGLLMAANQADAALRLAREVVAADTDAGADAETLMLAARAAHQAGALEQARTWLQAVPAVERANDWFRLQLHLASEAGDTSTALAAVHTLVERGAADARVRLWAARLAETAGDPSSAEAHLRAALTSDQERLVHLARLSLARLLLTRDRLDEAERYARAALDRFPGDATAARMLEAVRQANLRAAGG